MSDNDEVHDEARCGSTPTLVHELAELLDENDLSEIEVEDNGRRIVVKRKLAGVAAPRPPPAPPAPAARRRRCRAGSREPSAAEPSGTRSSRRWSAPSSCRRARRAAVRLGRRQRSSEGDTLLIIEAMKVMNPITAPARRQCQADPRPGRPAGRVRPAAGRSSNNGRWRSRRSSSPIAARSRFASTAPATKWASRRSRSIRPPTPRRCTSASPTRRSASARRRPPNPISTSRRSSRRPRSATPTRSIPATASFSENARFAEIVESHNIIWIGPKPEHIRTMGDKIEAKRTAAQARPAARPGLGRAGRERRGGARRSPPRPAIR